MAYPFTFRLVNCRALSDRSSGLRPPCTIGNILCSFDLSCADKQRSSQRVVLKKIIYCIRLI